MSDDVRKRKQENMIDLGWVLVSAFGVRFTMAIKLYETKIVKIRGGFCKRTFKDCAYICGKFLRT